MDSEKPDIRSLSLQELENYFVSTGERPFRARQLWLWLWQKGAGSFSEITSLSKYLRERIEKDFTLHKIKVDSMWRSADGTIKNAVKLHDGLIVESVMIPTETRATACVSSQVGCSMACLFCATAKLKQRRNLTAGEIVDQVMETGKQSRLYNNMPLSNIVFMGMGEPLLNYGNVVEAIGKITGDKALGMSWKRITVSTVGIAQNIKQLADEKNTRVNLALSLHSAIDEKRAGIIPSHKATSIAGLKEALKYWNGRTGLDVSLEYVIWKGFNDTREDVAALLNFCRGLSCKVNIIQYNSVSGSGFENASPEALALYQSELDRAGVLCVVRRSRGADIDAACGQLAGAADRHSTV